MMRTILKYAAVIAIVAIMGCSGDGSNEAIVTGDDTPVVVDPDDPHGPVVASAVTAQGIKFYDGESLWLWRPGDGMKADSRVYSNAETLYALDEYGNTTSTLALATAPDRVRIILGSAAPGMAMKAASTEIPLADAETWVVETISAEEAYALGKLYKPYTRIWRDLDEYGVWGERDFETDELTVHDGNIYARTTPGGAWYHINGDRTRIHTVIGGGFVAHDFDSAARTATIEGVAVAWSFNFFNAAKQWQYSGGKWYSLNGYTWDGTTLVENGSKMWDFRTLSNVVTAAGTRVENGETVLYWVRCDTGHVIRFVPSANQYIEFIRLYTGDGTSETGVYYKSTLKPIVIDDGLYFIFDADTFRYDFVSGLTSPFASGVSEVMEY